MTTETQLFAQPVLRGARFDDHSIPVDVLPMLEQYRDTVLGVARELYLKRTGRKRVPKNFDQGFQLVLSEIGEGSAKPHLLWVLTTKALLALQAISGSTAGIDGKELFIEAREVVSRTIAAASSSQQLPQEFPTHLLPKLKVIGDVLEDDESVEFRVTDSVPGPIYNTEVRTRIAAAIAAPSRDIRTFEGPVVAFDEIAQHFKIRTRDGESIQAQYRPEDADVVVALLSDRKFARAQLVVSALFDEDGDLEQVEELLAFTPWQATDEATLRQVEDRIASLFTLQPGWLDGQGAALPAEHLTWARELITELMVDDAFPRPRLFPTEEGHLEAEWTAGRWEVSATINLAAHSAYMHAANMDTLEDFDETIEDLDGPDSRVALADFLRQYVEPHKVSRRMSALPEQEGENNG